MRSGATTGGVRWLLRAEGLALLLIAVAAYDRFGMGWSVFGWCFLLPDLAFAGYLLGPRVGAVCYNATHSTIGAWLVLTAGVAGGSQVLIAAGLIWLAHIGFDRALGYGLKYVEGFGFTHLGKIGRQV